MRVRRSEGETVSKDNIKKTEIKCRIRGGERVWSGFRGGLS